MKKDLEDIYKQYNKEMIEANKKLPKPCYGNSDSYYCIYQCESRSGCYEVTMQKWGVCDCKFRPSCHISRQMLQKEFKKDDSNHECSFKKYFDEDLYPEIVVPEGIIKMKPIEY